MSPPWYKSRSYRARAVRDPRGVLKEFGVDLPQSASVRVHDSTADVRYAARRFSHLLHTFHMCFTKFHDSTADVQYAAHRLSQVFDRKRNSS